MASNGCTSGWVCPCFPREHIRSHPRKGRGCSHLVAVACNSRMCMFGIRQGPSIKLVCLSGLIWREKGSMLAHCEGEIVSSKLRRRQHLRSEQNMPHFHIGNLEFNAGGAEQAVLKAHGLMTHLRTYAQHLDTTQKRAAK